MSRRGKDVYSPKELYSPQCTKSNGAFREADPYRGSRYNDVLSTLKMGRGSSLGEVLRRSVEVRQTLATTLRQQRDGEYLKRQFLPRVPARRAGPMIVQTTICKNVAKRSENAAHSEVTNGGYTRTSYGGFFMH